MIVDIAYLIGILIGPFLFVYILVSLLREILLSYNKPKFWIGLSFCFLMGYSLSSVMIKNSVKNCQGKVFSNIQHHQVLCLKKGDKEIVLFGETHVKSQAAWVEGKMVVDSFDHIAIETSNLDGIPSWVSFLAWKERAVLDFLAYKVVGMKESSRDTARKKGPTLDLESTPEINLFDKEYQEDSRIFKNYVVDKRNLRIRFNILKFAQDRKPLLVVVGRNHIKGLERLLKEQGFK